jgi:hypothetical protein
MSTSNINPGNTKAYVDLNVKFLNTFIGMGYRNNKSLIMEINFLHNSRKTVDMILISVRIFGF